MTETTTPHRAARRRRLGAVRRRPRPGRAARRSRGHDQGEASGSHPTPGGRLLWLSPALPGRTHDLTAARTHRTIGIC